MSPQPPIVLCPGCQQPMKPGEPILIPSVPGLVDIASVCENCGMTSKRSTKTPAELKLTR
jgi:hypothetical protein